MCRFLHSSHFPVWCTSADESRRQTVVCPPADAAGLAISPCGADEQPPSPMGVSVRKTLHNTVHRVPPCFTFPIYPRAGQCFLTSPELPPPTSRPSSVRPTVERLSLACLILQIAPKILVRDIAFLLPMHLSFGTSLRLFRHLP
jgi:hypothetical protein